MMKWLAVLGLMVGCGPKASDACLDYTEAYAACTDDAVDAGLDVDVDNSDPEGFCLSFPDPDQVWSCQAAAVRATDCTSAQALNVLTSELDACRDVASTTSGT